MKVKIFLLIILLANIVACNQTSKQKTNNDNNLIEETNNSDLPNATIGVLRIENDDVFSNNVTKKKDADTILWDLLPPDVNKPNGIRLYNNYKVQSKNSGESFCLTIGKKEYKLSDILDYGELDILVYQSEGQEIIFIGLVDYYASTYYIYYLQNGTFSRLGDFSFNQPSDVEEKGMRKVTFTVMQLKFNVFVSLYLDGIFHKHEKFRLND